jgi:hypothetical protein
VASRDDDRIRLAAFGEPDETPVDEAHTRLLQDAEFLAQAPREKVAPVVEGDEVATQRPYRAFNILGHCYEIRIVIPADQDPHA